MLEAAKDRPQLHLILETICGTGIRVSELRFFTAEAVKRGEITVSCKSKTRTILLPSKLKKMLLDHAKKTASVLERSLLPGTGSRWTGAIFGRR